MRRLVAQLCCGLVEAPGRKRLHALILVRTPTQGLRLRGPGTWQSSWSCTPKKGGPKYERAALKYLARYLTEGKPSLADVAQMAALLAERSLIMRGL